VYALLQVASKLLQYCVSDLIGLLSMSNAADDHQRLAALNDLPLLPMQVGALPLNSRPFLEYCNVLSVRYNRCVNGPQAATEMRTAVLYIASQSCGCCGYYLTYRNPFLTCFYDILTEHCACRRFGLALECLLEAEYSLP
jgi:hypothetical protein